MARGTVNVPTKIDSVLLVGTTVERPQATKTDEYTKLLLHFDSDFTDLCGKTVTAYGNAAISSAQSKFGSASALFDGNEDYISTPGVDDWYFDTGDFTIDFWVRRNGTGSYPGIISCSDTSTGWAIGFGNGDNKIRVVWNSAQQILSTNAIPDLTWTHIALVRYGDTATLYINGVNNGSVSVAGVNINPDGNGALKIGKLNSSANYFFNGNVDEMRVSKGIARWTADFTPPASAYDWSSILLQAGAQYFDTTIGKPIWSNGTNWVDATGTTV